MVDEQPAKKADTEQIIDYVVGGAITAGGAALAVDGASKIVRGKTGAKKWFVMGTVAVVVAIFGFMAGIGQFFAKEQVEVLGTVISIRPDNIVDSYCTPTAEYLAKGVKHLVSLPDSTDCTWTIGDEVTVAFDKGTGGQNARLGGKTSPWQTLGSSLFFGFVGLILSGIGFLKFSARAAEAGVGVFLAKKGLDRFKSKN